MGNLLKFEKSSFTFTHVYVVYSESIVIVCIKSLFFS